MIKKINILILLCSFSFALGPWTWTKRVHTELEWSTIETQNYRIHYHQGIESIAQKGASIAEQIHPTLLKQMDLESVPMIDVIFTSEDEIMNGYAMWTNQTFIWVDQNDAAVWLEDGKWLYQVLAHELQHIMYFNTVKTWLPEPMNIIISKTPGWFVEGLAEYMTEHWRPQRSEISHKYHVLKNSLNKMDPHHDGYSKLLMMGEMFGDSTIAQILHHRNSVGLFNFKKAFKEITNTPINQFLETWRLKINTYYYGYRSQKEDYEDVGVISTLPIKHIGGFAFSPDSLKYALTGRPSDNQYDQSFFIATIDTSIIEDKPSFFDRFKSDSADTTNDKKSAPRVTKEEIDFGRFHNSSFSWSLDSKKIAYAKFRYGTHGSMLWDIKVYNTETEHSEWMTQDMRATYPIWSHDNQSIYFSAHKNGISNIYNIDIESKLVKQITQNKEDIQILNLSLSPDGTKIAYAKSAPDANLDIYTFNVISSVENRMTEDPAAEYLPLWSDDGKNIIFTSHINGTPNLVNVETTTKTTQMLTDVGDGIWGVQNTPNDSTIIAIALSTADSVRIIHLNQNRTITTNPLNIRDQYTSWKTHSPDLPLMQIDDNYTLNIVENSNYRFYKNWKHLMSIIIPLDSPFGLTSFEDPLGKHIIQVLGGTMNWKMEDPFYQFSYINAQHGPLWGLNYFHHTNIDFREYDGSDSGLLEFKNGLNIWMQHPINFGNNMSSNHSIESGFSLIEREVLDVKDIVDDESIAHVFDEYGLKEPEEGNETLFNIKYTFVNRRPHKKNLTIPKHGYGFQARVDAAISDIYGDFNYQRLTFDSFVNHQFGLGIFFLRGKSLSLWGNAPAQDYIGFSSDKSLYFPGSQGTSGLTENMNLRGHNNVSLGDQLLYGTLEYRMSLFSSFPAEFLGIKLTDFIVSTFTDIGSAWYRDSDSPKWINTAGAEVKFAINIGGSPFIFIAYGYAQLVEDWINDVEPSPYWQTSLVNPF